MITCKNCWLWQNVKIERADKPNTNSEAQQKIDAQIGICV